MAETKETQEKVLEAFIAVQIPSRLLTRIRLNVPGAEAAVVEHCAKYAAALAAQIVGQAKVYGANIPSQEFKEGGA